MAKSHEAPPTTTSVDKADQKGRLLRIETTLSNNEAEKKLPGDPVLLTKLDGEEGFSIPYVYDILMYRSTAKNKTNPITADMLIGTKALIHCRGDDENCDQMGLTLTRMGIFITFEQLESDKPEDYVKFGARLVPPFKLLDYESGFRVWEQISVIDIMKQALMTGTTIPIDTLDFGMIEEEQKDDPNAFPKLEYCVQFGETTFNFLSRLMKEYGIWYYFGNVDKADGSAKADNELMRFGRKRMDQFANVKSQHIARMRVSKEPPAFDVDLPTFDIGGNKGWTVSSWRRTFIPAPFIQFDGGNFNQMDPSNPIDASDKIKAQRDLFTQKSQQSYDRARVIRQVFPTPAELNDHKEAKGVGKEYEAESQYVDTRIDEGTGKTSLVSGISKNPTFAPGLVFTTDADLTGRGEENKAFTLTRVQISAFDLDYDFLTPGMLLEDVWDKTLSQLKGTDGSTSAVSQGLQDFMSNLTNQQTSSSGQGQNIFNAPDAGTGFNDVAGALTGALTSALVSTAGAFGSNLLKDLFADRSGYANNFVCIDPEEGTAVLPTPGGTKPKVHGPHLALVIGPDENDELSTKKMDVYGDKFGRVRVRFPWDKEHFLLRPDIAGSNTRPAAWVRVSEGWAGRQWGHQFMPRIGQEVVVEFLDGDPDRPIITGRVYNSDHGPINQPFPANQRTDEVLKLDDWLEPKEAQHRYAGIKTSSIPVVDGDGKPLPAGFHLLRFDDTRGKEQYLVRSQRRLDITALERRYESISSDRHLTVGGKKLTPPPPEIGGDYIAKVFRHYHLHVGDPAFPTQSGNRNTLLEQNENFQSKGSANYLVGGNWSVTLGGVLPVGGQATIDVPGVGGMIVLNAPTGSITLSCGASSIVITPAAISITSAAISLNGVVLGTPPVPTPTPIPPFPPVDAGPVTPKDPTPADPGDKLTPPQE
jgi:uncharacterized protein involved in type VI secretion and phage assembly